jgi:hypothetical protein
LLVLAGEIVFADRPSDVVEGFERLAIWVQSLTLTAAEAFRFPNGLDPVHLVGFGAIAGKLTTSQGSCARTWPTRSSSCSRCMMMTIAPLRLSLSRL